MSTATYDILDEPSPGGLAHLAVNPVWPLLGVMLGGAWLAWPWFVLNALAVGSPTRTREIAWVFAGFVGTAGLLVALVVASERELIVGVGLRYALVALVVWKLMVSYRLYMLQARTFELYRYFGGTVRNGFLPVIVGMFLRPKILEMLPPLAQLILV